MRVAALSDIHGNLPALEAVLREVDAAGADVIVLPGDMTVGPLQWETLDLLASLGERAVTVSLEVDGLGTVLFCHATARDDEEIVLVDSPVGWFAEGFGGVEEATVVCGHTHMPFDRLAGGRRFVNPGSVGMPYGPPGTAAYWALLGPDVTLRRSPYDAHAAAQRLRPSAGPDNQAFIDDNVLHGPPGDAEVLALFSQWARERRGL